MVEQVIKHNITAVPDRRWREGELAAEARAVAIADHEDSGILAFAAGIERQNYLSRWVNDKIRGISTPTFAPDPQYLPAEDEENLRYDPRQVGWAQSAEEAAYIRGQIDKEYAQLETIAASSGGMIGEIYGGIFRPEVVVSGGVAGVAGLGLRGVVAAEAIAEVGSEVLLHQQQRTRTMQESLINIGLVTATTAIVGVAVRGYKKGPSTFKQDVPEVDDLGADEVTDSAGAAARDPSVRLSAEDAALADNLGIPFTNRGIMDVIAVGPAARLTRSESGIARALSDDLVDKGYYTKAMQKGETRGQTIESQINQTQGEVITVLDQLPEIQKRSGLDWDTFDVEVGKALSNKGRHANQQVSEAAEVLRSQILEPRRAALNDMGAEIGEKPLGAQSYFPRIYSRQAIIDNYQSIKNDLVEMYSKEFGAARASGPAKVKLDEVQAKTDKLDADITQVEAQMKKYGDLAVARSSKDAAEAAAAAKQMKGKTVSQLEDMHATKAAQLKKLKVSSRALSKDLKAAKAAARKAPTTPPAKGAKGVQAKARGVVAEQQRINKEVAAEADRAAKDTIQNMLGGLPIGHGITGGTPSPLKARSIKLTDKMLEQYRELSATNVISKYTGSMDPHLIMREAFGDEMLSDKLVKIGKDYQELIDVAPTSKARDALRKKMASDIKDIEQLRNRLLHRVQRSVDPSSTAEKTVQFVKTINVATQLGGIMLSSIPDMARPLMTYGMRSFVKGFGRGMKDYIKSVGTGGISQPQMRRMGIASQRTLNSRLMDMAELGEPSSKATAGMQKAWGKLTGFDHWTDAMESIAAQSAMDWTLRMSKKVAAGRSLSRTETMKVARMGFTQDDLSSFLKASERSGGASDPDLMFANTLEWGDIDLARHFEAGIGSDVRRNIVRIGAGDKPIAMDNNLTSLIFQYQSFALASTNRMLVAGLQQRDINLLSGLLVSAALGMTVGYTKSSLRGQDFTKKPGGEMFREGIDRSGILGVYNVAFNHLRNVAGDAPSRYAHRGPVSVLGGSTIGQAENLALTAAALQEGEGGEAIGHSLKMVPFINAMHFRDLMLRLGLEEILE